mmetsp:Transcript_7198/g.21190  ORF Transcript_7198/g.21190 Transcript_7198/m.21190 type:complete len:341 (-) Transcript_7198:2030-3052(-)
MHKSLRKLLHQPIDLLRLAWQPEAVQKFPDGLIKVHAGKVHGVHIGVHHGQGRLLALAQVLPHHRLLQPAGLGQELGHLLGAGAHHLMFLHVGNALLGLLVEQRNAALEIRFVCLPPVQQRRLLVTALAAEGSALVTPHHVHAGGLLSHQGSSGQRRSSHCAGVPLHQRPQDVDAALQGQQPQGTLILLDLHRGVGRGGRLGDTHQSAHHALEQVGTLQVAVVVHEQVHQQLPVAALSLQASQHYRPLPQVHRLRSRLARRCLARSRWLDGAQQDHGEEHANLRLQGVPELADEGQEDAAAQPQRVRVGRGAVLEQAQAQVVLDAVCELLAGGEHAPAVL